MPQRPTAHASVLEDYWIGPTLVSLAYGSASPHQHTNQRRSVPTRSLTLRRRRPTITHHQTSTSRALRQAPLVLIVDDSADTRELYTEYLTSRRFRVVSAADGNAGVLTALGLRPDVIVMDLAMPVLNGTKAIARLKTDPRTRRVPIIVLTGYAFRAIQEGALETGADVFLTKPCLPEELEGQVRKLFDVSRRKPTRVGF